MRELKIGDRVKYVADSNFEFLRGKTGTVKGFYISYALVEFDEYINGHDGLHRCNVKTKDGHGYYVSKGNLSVIQPAANEKIVITTDGKTTVAKLYDGDKVVKEAKADCSPEDKFDFTQGAKLAFERLTHTFKFEVGKMYANADKSIIIKIIDAKKMSHDNRYYYDRVKGDGFCFFDEGSVFASTLTPYEPPQVYNGKVVCVKTAYPEYWTVGKVYCVVDGVTRNNNGSSRTGITAENLRHIGSNENEFIPLVE